MIGEALRRDRVGVAAGWVGPALLVVAAITVFRLGFVLWTGLELDFEEAQYWFWSRDLAWGYFSKPPLIAWLISGATALCGDGEACIRWPAPLIHAATAMTVGAIGAAVALPAARRRVAFWSAIGFATLPGVSFSAFLMTTDVPLLFFWSVALLAWIRLLQGGPAPWAVAGGAALGLGLLAKYAMAYFLLCAVLHLVLSPASRRTAAARAPALLLFAALGLAIVAPNLAWNAGDGFITFRHTAENVNLGGDLLHPGRLLEFFFSQFGVFGPILFAALLAGLPAWLRRRGEPGESEARLALGAFSYPIVGLLLAQALVSRANANWAAPAYVAATVWVTHLLLAQGRARLVAVSAGLHVAAGLALYLVLAAVPAVALPGVGAKPVAARLHGWAALGDRVAGHLAALPGGVLVSEDRQLLAVLVYYAGLAPDQIGKWNGDRDIDDHFELIGATAQEAAARGAARFVLISEWPDPAGILGKFESARLLETVEIPLGAGLVRRHFLYELGGYRG